MESFRSFALVAYDDFGRGPTVLNRWLARFLSQPDAVADFRNPYTFVRLKKARFE